MIVDFGNGNTLNVVYDPIVITSNMMLDLRNNSDELTKILSELIVRWDLTDNSGAPFDPTPENLANTPLLVVNKIFESIFADAFPKAASTSSDDSTPATARRVTKTAR